MSEAIAAEQNVYVLARPIVFDDQEIKELVLNFDDLTGNDLLQAERLAERVQGYTPNFVPLTNTTYQACVVAKASGVVPELILALKAADFSKVTMQAASFLLRSE